MRVYDIIKKKRDGGQLSKEEIQFLVDGYVDGDIPDYQMSAFLMAVYFNKMTDEETVNLTLAMANSGDTVDLSAINGIKVDKHSTGGVGDKTTLIVIPIVASLGVKVAKMSGRGLGHTGGTIDKLESITGYKTSLSKQDFFKIVEQVGASVIGQSGNLAPADKKLYALRDVTATVDCIPLIVSSIMSKKLASGSDAICLDVKCGSGAFMKSVEDATLLATQMVKIGKMSGKKMCALITDMSIPLGRAIGNSLEVIEAVEVLKNKNESNLKDVCVELASYMLYLANYGEIATCKKAVLESIKNGKAFDTFKQMVKMQGGDQSMLDDTSKFEGTKYSFKVLSTQKGYISKIDAEKFGLACVRLGGGRSKKEDNIDYSAGILLNRTVGDFVEKGEEIVTIYTNDENSLKESEQIIVDAVEYQENPVNKTPIILDVIL